MRNLKKLLSLVLVFALVLGLGMTAFAVESVDNTTLSDWEEVEHKEAVKLLGLLGVMKGNTDGTFNPQGILKRGEAMALICRALWQGDDQSNLYKGSNPGNFSDIGADGWSMGYISYGFVMDFIGGNGDGTVTPLANVTGEAFLKMVLCALGADNSRYVNAGSGWAAVVIADAQRLGLVDGIVISEFNPSAGLTRDNAAQIVYNMMGTPLLNGDASIKMFETDTSDWVDKIVTVKNDQGDVTGTQITPVWVTSSSKDSKTFGAENFGYVKKTGVLVDYEWGTIYDGSSFLSDINKDFADGNNPANGTKYVNAVMRVYEGKNSSYQDTWTLLDLTWNDITGEPGPEALGETFEVVKIGNDILGWSLVGSTEITYNSSDKGKTVNAALGLGRYINNAPATAAAVKVVIADLFAVDTVATADVSNTTVHGDWTFIRQAIENTFDDKADELAALDAAVTTFDGKTKDNVSDAVTNTSSGIVGKIEAIDTSILGTTDDLDIESAAVIAEAQRLKDIAYANARFGANGNDTSFFDYNGDGKADVMLVTDYAFDWVAKIGTNDFNDGEGKVDAVQFGTYGWTQDYNVVSDVELAKDDYLVYVDYFDVLFVQEVLTPFEGTISRYNSASNKVTIDGVAYDQAGINNATSYNASHVGNEGDVYLWNGFLTFVKGAVTPEDTYGVVYGVYAYVNSASSFGGGTTDVRVLIACEDGVTRNLPLASLEGVTLANILKANAFGSGTVTLATETEIAKYIITGSTSGGAGFTDFTNNVYQIDDSNDNAIAFRTYWLSADGKSIHLGDIEAGTPKTPNSDYDSGKNVIALDGSTDAFINSNSVFFILANDQKSYQVFKGIGKIPSLDIDSSAKITYILDEWLNTGTSDTVAYAIVNGKADIQKSDAAEGIFAVIGGYDVVGTDKYEFDLFDGTTVKTVSSEVAPDFDNAIYTEVTFNGDGVVTAMGTAINHKTTDAANLGYISTLADGSLRFVNLDETATIVLFSTFKNFYLVDGENSKTLTAAQAAELIGSGQTAPDEGKYIAFVDATDAGDTANTIILFGSAI